MKNFYIVILLIFSAVFFSCEDLLVKELDLEDFDFEKQLVVSGIIENDNEDFLLYVSENTAITETYSDPFESAIDNATVNLYRGTALVGSPEYLEDEGLYYMSLAGLDVSEGEYKVEISAPSFNDISANTSIPVEVPLKNIEYIEDAGIHPETLESADAIKITFDDPEGDNYYGFSIAADEFETIIDTFINGTDTVTFEFTPFINLASNDPDIVSITGDELLLPDDFFNGREKSVTIFLDAFGFDISEIKESILITWENLSEEKYLFTRSLDLYNSSGDFGPFSEAVSVYTNVENGLGYFAGTHFSNYDIP